jgi:hypothetical protein
MITSQQRRLNWVYTNAGVALGVIDKSDKCEDCGGNKKGTIARFAIRRIAEIMEISPNAVMRYQKKELTPEWIQFADNIKKIYGKENRLLWLCRSCHYKRHLRERGNWFIKK